MHFMDKLMFQMSWSRSLELMEERGGGDRLLLLTFLLGLHMAVSGLLQSFFLDLLRIIEFNSGY
ncbi:hypothetical protein Hdeb2414_s0011g00363731 [Helianthus debilis subsp. tardiflorus]